MLTSSEEKTKMADKKLKVLIGDDSLEQGTAWASEFKRKGIHVITRAKDGKVILEQVKNDMPDVLIIESKMPHLDAVALIESMRKLTEQLPVIFVIANIDNPINEREVMSLGAKYYMVKPFDSRVLIERVEKMIGMSEPKAVGGIIHDEVPDDAEYIVTDIIHQVGIPAHVKGYHYLRTAILLSIENHDMINSVTKLLYPTVAKKFTTTSSRVERAIRHAIEIAWDRGDSEVLGKYFGYSIQSQRGKPTNSEFIALIADKLRLQFRSKGQYVASLTK